MSKTVHRSSLPHHARSSIGLLALQRGNVSNYNPYLLQRGKGYDTQVFGNVFHSPYDVQQGQGLGTLFRSAVRVLKPLAHRGLKIVGEEGVKAAREWLDEPGAKDYGSVKNKLHQVARRVRKRVIGMGRVKKGGRRRKKKTGVRNKIQRGRGRSVKLVRGGVRKRQCGGRSGVLCKKVVGGKRKRKKRVVSYHPLDIFQHR